MVPKQESNGLTETTGLWVKGILITSAHPLFSGHALIRQLRQLLSTKIHNCLQHIASFSAKPKITLLIQDKTNLADQTDKVSTPVNISEDQLSHVFSACTTLKPTSSILESVSLLKQQPLNRVGVIPVFVNNCWPKY